MRRWASGRSPISAMLQFSSASSLATWSLPALAPGASTTSRRTTRKREAAGMAVPAASCRLLKSQNRQLGFLGGGVRLAVRRGLAKVSPDAVAGARGGSAVGVTGLTGLAGAAVVTGVAGGT